MTHSGLALIDPNKIFSAVGLAKGMRVADLGCGRTGHFVFMAAREVEETGVVYAVDILKDVLENITSRIRSEGYENVQPIWSDIEKFGAMPIPEKSLDICFVVNVMYGLKNRASTLKESARLLKEGGYMAIVDWSKRIGPLGPAEASMIKPEEIIALAEEAGLSLENNFPAGDYHFCLIFKKK